MLQSMDDLERTWNHKFNYPWTFFNDVPFTEEFKKKTSAATKAKTYYCTHPSYRKLSYPPNHPIYFEPLTNPTYNRPRPR
jgi:hypothetical protein